MASFADEMRLFNEDGNRLYLNADERARFLEASKDLEPHYRIAGEVIHFTGCRPSEVLQLYPRRVFFKDCALQFQTVKKRKYTKGCKPKKPEYRLVPVPAEIITNLDLVFNIRKLQCENKLDVLFWPVTRLTLWRQMKKTMDAAGISGSQATMKGFRHSFGVAMTLIGMDMYMLAQRLDHANAATTQIYHQVIGEDDHKLQIEYWEKANAVC